MEEGWDCCPGWASRSYSSGTPLLSSVKFWFNLQVWFSEFQCLEPLGTDVYRVFQE